jgi:transcription-repair coupling factor (superfamily II helicase)
VLGSGYALAQRDLEIRGAGSLLGADQSGEANDVGVKLYMQVRESARAGASEQRQTERERARAREREREREREISSSRCR